jgi:hypothetical protein
MRLATLSMLVTIVVAYPSFRDHVPNGFAELDHPALGHVAVSFAKVGLRRGS